MVEGSRLQEVLQFLEESLITQLRGDDPQNEINKKIVKYCESHRELDQVLLAYSEDQIERYSFRSLTQKYPYMKDGVVRALLLRKRYEI